MKMNGLSRAALVALAAFCAPIFAQSSKVAIIDIQGAIARTEEGQKLIKELEERYQPTQQEIEATNKEIDDLRANLNRGQNTMSDAARRDLARQIEQKERDATRKVEDARGEFNQDQQKIFNDVGGKLMAVIDKYAKDNSYAIVLDISSPQSPVLYAVNEVNITAAIIAAYDADGGATAAAAGATAAKPAQ
jgi:outer membrane protein